MSQQLTIQPLFYQRRIDAAFERFHGERPEVFKWFKHYADVYKKRGFKRISADFLLHIVRHHIAIEKSANEFVKINNSYSPLYARKLMSEDERFKDFFETRQRKSM